MDRYLNVVNILLQLDVVYATWTREREREGVCDVIKRVLLSQHKWIYHKYKMRSKVISMLPLDCSYATKCHDHGG